MIAYYQVVLFCRQGVDVSDLRMVVVVGKPGNVQWVLGNYNARTGCWNCQWDFPFVTGKIHDRISLDSIVRSLAGASSQQLRRREFVE